MKSETLIELNSSFTTVLGLWQRQNSIIMMGIFALRFDIAESTVTLKDLHLVLQTQLSIYKSKDSKWNHKCMKRLGIMRLVDSRNRFRFFSVLADEITDAYHDLQNLCFIYRRKLRSRRTSSAAQPCTCLSSENSYFSLVYSTSVLGKVRACPFTVLINFNSIVLVSYGRYMKDKTQNS